MDIKKWSPWNWFKKEKEIPVQHSPSLPTVQNEVATPMLRLHQDIDRLFDDTFRRFGIGLPSLFGQMDLPGWSRLIRPALDISENDKQYTITLEVPGVGAEDIQINLEEDTLVIQGEKRQEQEQREGGYHRIERSYGAFQRILSLPEDANPESIQARFKNGVLTLNIDKRTPITPKQGRKIEIENLS